MTTPSLPTTPDDALEAPALSDGAVGSAVTATYIAFIGAGFALSSWATRIPQVKSEMGLSSSELGLVLLAIAAGSIASLPLAGSGVARWGSRAVVVWTSVGVGVAFVGIGVGYQIGVPALVVALAVLGFANGAWDVAMNVQGAIAERALGRSIMARFHAGFSVGTVAGALVGAGVVALHIPVWVHLVVVGVLVAVVVPLGVRRFLPDDALDTPVAHDEPVVTRSPWAAWREPRTVLVGVFVLAFAFAEGTGNDWIALAAINGYGVSAAVGTLAFAVFLAAMTAGRWFGPTMLDRYGRVPVVRLTAVLAVVGLLLFVFGGHSAVAFVGVALWGLGTSLGFPVGMSAGADEPRYAAGRVSVIASIGYVAFLGGPPLIGFLGDHEGILRSLTVVAVLLGIACLVSSATRELPSPDRSSAVEAGR